MRLRAPSVNISKRRGAWQSHKTPQAAAAQFLIARAAALIGAVYISQRH